MLENFPDSTLKALPGTYALILQSHATTRIQIGHWRKIEAQPGYYIYVGSAFGTGGVRARVSRHLRIDKPKHWHIDYLRAFVTTLAVWVSYEPKKLEHQWAQTFFRMRETTAIYDFGCSDCKCASHLFHTRTAPDFATMHPLLNGTSQLCQFQLLE